MHSKCLFDKFLSSGKNKSYICNADSTLLPGTWEEMMGSLPLTIGEMSRWILNCFRYAIWFNLGKVFFFCLLMQKKWKAYV